MLTAPKLQIYPPPQTQVSDDSWRRWFVNVVWPILGAGVESSGPQGTFPQLQVGKARFTNANAFQELLNVDQGFYVNYSSAVNNIIYGYACNVHRSAGTPFVVGAQINAIGDVAGITGVFGIACTAASGPFTGDMPLIAFEPDIASIGSANTKAKWGMNPVFKDRLDGAVATTEGLGSNLYNYFSMAMALTSQVRSTDAEFCGWNVGLQFLDGCLDASTVPAWNNTTTYQPGQIVSSAGVTWKAIVANTNVAPAVGVTWVQFSSGGVSGKAVGIDFSCLSTTTMGRMASAIRLRSSMYVHWEETGVVGTKFDAGTGILHLVDNAGAFRFGIDVGSGLIRTALSSDATGAGAAATLGNVGGTGPSSAAQAAWGHINFGGSDYWMPLFS